MKKILILLLTAGLLIGLGVILAVSTPAAVAGAGASLLGAFLLSTSLLTIEKRSD